VRSLAATLRILQTCKLVVVSLLVDDCDYTALKDYIALEAYTALDACDVSCLSW
jgi:hypothetical protein